MFQHNSSWLMALPLGLAHFLLNRFPWSLIHWLSHDLWFTIHALGKSEAGQGSKGITRNSNVTPALYGSKCTLQFQLSENSTLHLLSLNEYGYDHPMLIKQIIKNLQCKRVPKSVSLWWWNASVLDSVGGYMNLYMWCNTTHQKKGGGVHVKTDKIWTGPIV